MFEAPRRVPTAAVRAADAPSDFAPAEGIDLQAMLQLIWRGKTTILWTTAAALAAAVLFILLAPHHYTATAQMLIDPTDLRVVANDVNPTNQANDANVLQVESQVQVLTSDNVLRRVIKAEGLDNDPEFLGRFLTAATNGAAAALITLRRNLSVKRAERTYVVDVSMTSHEAAKAARIANAVVKAYLDEETKVRADAAEQVSKSLGARLNELKDRVREAEDRAEAFKERNNIIGAGGQLVNEQQLTELNNQLGLARAHATAAKARLDQIRLVQQSKDEAGAFAEAVQSQTVAALRSQYAEIMRREAEQMSSLGPRHPAVVEIQAEADRLHRMIEDEVKRIALSARAEYQSARADEDTLAADLEKLKSNAVATNEAMVTLRELDREVQASRAVYEAFLVRARETGEQGRVDTKNIRVISQADIPLRRSFPPSSLVLAAGALLIGAAAGTGIVLVRGRIEAKPPPTGGARFGRPVGAVAGSAPPTRLATVPVLAVLPNVDVAFGLNAAENPRSRFAMEIRKVLAAVREGRGSGKSNVLVVATNDEDDTIVVPLALAAVAAAAKQRVLLVDTDAERRTLSAIDADDNDAGLVDVATGRRDLSEVIVRDRETKINLLPLVAPGSRRERPIEEADVKRAFDQTGRFDLVIVAAIELSRNPSTTLFAGLVDHIILVTRADDETGGVTEQFISRLGPDARKIRGVVLTGTQTAS
jgi:polysaccharide biosynthesis transport protein